MFILCLVAQLCPTFCNPMDCSPPGSPVCGDSPGKNTGVSCHVLLHGIFPTQELNPGLPHCFPCGSAGKETACNVGDLGSIPGLGRSPGEGKGYPLEYSGLENSMDYNSPWGRKEWDMTERLSLSLPHCRRILYRLSHQGSSCLYTTYTVCIWYCYNILSPLLFLGFP